MLLQIMVCLVLMSSSGMLLSTDHCYTDIGCFPITPDFYHPRYRPINVRPWHRSRIKTTFTLFNSDQTEGYVMRPWNHLNLQASRFNPLLETKLIIPGWLDNMKRTLWVKKLKDSFLWLWEPVNIVVVEWVNFTPYTIATANTRVVGAEIANMLKFLEEVYEYKRSYYHLIGHSLGAHIAAYCGDRLPGLGRITALDPARPFFQHMPKSVRLDRGDAKFVDAIHSDFTPENAFLIFITSFGLSTPVGHVDFFPNGPALLQPGCFRDALWSVPRGFNQAIRHQSMVVGFMEAIRYLIACDHQRAHEWFIESVTNQECMFVGVRCSDYDGVVNGRCSCDDSKAACAIMGIHSDQMYLHGVHNDMPDYLRKLSLSPSFKLNSAPHLQQPHFSALNPLTSFQQQQQQQQHRSKSSGHLLVETSQDGGLVADFDSINDSSERRGRVAGKLISKQQDKWNTITNSHHYYDRSSSVSFLTNNHANVRNTQPKLLSEINHEIESWYENNNRWFLMTNNRRLYCVHQYQVLVFVGYLPNLDYVKANLIMSIIGTEGRLLNQRFLPRGGRLTSDSLQPFYVVFESAFSLGTIQSIALAWEPKNRQDNTVKAKIEITNPTLLQIQSQLDTLVPTINVNMPYKANKINVQSTKQQYLPHSHTYKRMDAPRQTASFATVGVGAGHRQLSIRNSGHHGCKSNLISADNNNIEDSFCEQQSTFRLRDAEFPWPTSPLPLARPRVNGLDQFELDDTFELIHPESVMLPSVPKAPVHIQHQYQKQNNKAMETIDLLLATFSRNRDDSIFLVINQIRITPVQAYYGKNHHVKISQTFCPPHKNYLIPHKQTVQFRSNSGSCFVS